MATAPQKAATAKPAFATAATKSDKRDGLLGSLLFDCLFGMPLSDMLGDVADELPMDGNPALSAGIAVDMYDEYRADRANKDRTNAKLGVSGSVIGMFNRLGTGAIADAPRRLNLEDQYAVTARMKRPPGLYMAA